MRVGFTLALSVLVAVTVSPVARASSNPGPWWTASPLSGTTSGARPVALAVVSPSDAWVVGNADRNGGTDAFGWHWNGASWMGQILPESTPAAADVYNQLFAVTADSTQVFAAGNGDFNQANSGVIIDRYAGGSWTYGAGATLSPPTDYTNPPAAFAEVGPSNIWLALTEHALGSTDLNAEAAVLEHWNGSSWSVMPRPSGIPDPATTDKSNSISAFSVISRTNIWGVGSVFWHDAVTGYNSRPLIIHYNGLGWQRVAAPPATGQFDGYSDVAAISPTDVWAVGTGGAQRLSPLLAHYDGTSWTTVSVPAAPSGAELASVAATGSHDVWALGGAGSGHAFYLHYDGHAWQQLAPPYDAGQVVTSGLGSIAVNQGTYWALGGQTVERLNPERLSASGFSQPSVQVHLGGTPDFLAGSTTHTLADASPFHLYSAVVQAGYSATPYRYVYAATYPLHDSPSGTTATIGVPPSLAAYSVSSGTKVPVAWAAVAAPTGYTYDVQVDPPGGTGYHNWITGVTSRASSYTPTTSGTYLIRARLRRLGTTQALAWSPAARLVVH
ncbi:MAG TPA: hypothetical protein VFH74_08255 [Gaiellales bacterium]|nr:hypothetical protein [Gaiellales bacterium]